MTPRRALSVLLVCVGALVIAYAGLARAGVSWDLTAEGSATLSAETRRVLDRVDRRVEIVAFFTREAPGRVEAATLLSRYRDANRLITFKVVDPELAPGEVQRFGIEAGGSAAVREVGDDDRVEIAQYTIEIDLTSALARLLRDTQGTVCFVTGSGERPIDDTSSTGLSEAARLLRSNGYKTRAVDLLTKDADLERCDAAVIAAPSNEPNARTTKALRAFLEADGKAWILTEPGTVDLTPITKPWGIRFLSGVLLEGDAESHLPGDPASPIVRRYAGGSSVVRGLGPTFYPRAQGVDVVEPDDRGLTVTEIAATSRLGYLDRDDISEFDPDVDAEGPVAVGVAADDSEVSSPGTSDARIRRTRVLAWGDTDFVSNAFISEGSNGRLWVQGVDWLTQPEDLVTAVPTFPQVRELELTEARSRYILFLMAGVVPGLFVIAGAMVWVLRRSR